MSRLVSRLHNVDTTKYLNLGIQGLPSNFPAMRFFVSCASLLCYVCAALIRKQESTIRHLGLCSIRTAYLSFV